MTDSPPDHTPADGIARWILHGAIAAAVWYPIALVVHAVYIADSQRDILIGRVVLAFAAVIFGAIMAAGGRERYRSQCRQAQAAGGEGLLDPQCTWQIGVRGAHGKVYGLILETLTAMGIREFETKDRHAGVLAVLTQRSWRSPKLRVSVTLQAMGGYTQVRLRAESQHLLRKPIYGAGFEGLLVITKALQERFKLVTALEPILEPETDAPDETSAP